MLHVRGESAAAATEALGNLAAKNTANKDATRKAGGVVALAAQFLMLTNGPVPDKFNRLHRPMATSAQIGPIGAGGSGALPSVVAKFVADPQHAALVA